MANPTDAQYTGIEAVLHDTNAWLAVSFVIFVFVLVKFGKSAITSMLDKRIEKIKHDIETAENLRVEAQELLAQYQRKQRNAEKESERILDDAKRNAYNIKKAAEKELKDLIKRKEKQLEDRISRAKDGAMHEIQAYAADLAVLATQEIIADKMDAKKDGALVKDAIAGIKQIH